MRVILSRKGFDSAAGGTPSPIVGGRPVSLPIPAHGHSATTYADRGLGALVERVTGGRIGRDDPCHDDPMFAGGQCLFGQCGAAQAHLRNQGVGMGDVFLFFGLFAGETTGERHHRIFGYLKVAETLTEGLDGLSLDGRPHPHGIGVWDAGNTVYRGPGAMADRADDVLRLTRPGGPLLHWSVPPWLRRTGLSYHRRAERWLDDGGLIAVARGQEFVADIGDDREARDWVGRMVAAIGA